MNCPSSGMQGTGTVKQTATTMEANMTMKGQKMEMQSQTTGKRQPLADWATKPCH
jgi:hypothetical protein